MPVRGEAAMALARGSILTTAGISEVGLPSPLPVRGVAAMAMALGVTEIDPHHGSDDRSWGTPPPVRGVAAMAMGSNLTLFAT